MSRALDDSVKKALKSGNQYNVFTKISSAITNFPGELLEIELMGHSPHLDDETVLLQDGNAIAIPKLRLVQAFIVARQIIWEHTKEDDLGTHNDVLKATAVMLLMDPEYLTAANTRKRIIKKSIASGENAGDMLNREKHLVDSLLTSRLHRHTKSPTLWNHRRWLMAQFQASITPVDASNDLVKVVMVSGERHPRNYYAWCHARYLTTAFAVPSQPIISETRQWCFRHHDDISGWQFLAFLLLQRHADASTAASVVGETVKLAESFKWRNESVWYFLRSMAPALGNAEQAEVLRAKEALYQGAAVEDTKTLDRAMQWAKLG